MTVEDIRARLEQIVDPSLKKTLKETEGIKHIGIDDETKTLVLIVAMGTTEEMKSAPYVVKLRKQLKST